MTPVKFARAVSSSVRYKLLGLVLLPLLLVMPIIIAVTVFWSQKYTFDQLRAKVNTDLAVAHDVFRRLQENYLNQLGGLAESYGFRTAFEARSWPRIKEQLELVRKTTDIDFLHVVGQPGSEVVDTLVPRLPSPILEQALRLGKPGVGVELMFRDDISTVIPDRAGELSLRLIDTPRAAPTSRTMENRAMLVRAVYPVKNEKGSVVAALDGGVLLNNNHSFVDAIRDLVYGPGSVAEGGWGTVTVLLDDVRISTNVPLARGERALGTRVSQDVRDHVLGLGQVWVDRAFVVNDWYISAYEPIVDVYGERVGMLYAGFLERPYREAYTHAVAVLFIAVLLAVLLAAWLAIRGAKSIFRPIEAMTAMVRAAHRGDLAQLGDITSQDEIGELARRFDALLKLLNERNEQVTQAADLLERKVGERTRELRDQNRRLQNTIDLLRKTRRQLVIAEKLAALGELTAGVAHEINNPVAVILGNMDILVNELGQRSSDVQTEINLIIEQAYRIRAIVDRLLQYARPSQRSGGMENLEVNGVVDDTLVLVRHELDRKQAQVDTVYQAKNLIQMSRQELQQVLVNLLVNAAQSIAHGGTIRIHTFDNSDEVVEIVIEDNGGGIADSEITRVFDPFYTSKSSGTGLGLSVSYGVVRRYGGRISVESQEGEWTRFTIALLCDPEYEPDEEMLLERHASGPR